MTREEAIRFLSNTKVYVNGKSKEIQEKLFSLGFQWGFQGKRVFRESKPFLFLWGNMKICYGDNMEHFTRKTFREITVTDILNIVIDEPKYRPFKDSNECWNEMLKHDPFGWVQAKESTVKLYIFAMDKLHVETRDRIRDYKSAFEFCDFVDGTPFGIKEEEES